jgi:uncharacterized protein (DUF4415 family)
MIRRLQAVFRREKTMPRPPGGRRPSDPFKAAEAAFKKVTTKPVEGPAKAQAIPGVKETVTLRIDQDVLEFFQQDGPGWQDRINAALRKIVGKSGE